MRARVRRMDIKYPPFVDVNAELKSVKALGTQTAIINLTVKGKPGTITMNRKEAESLIAGIKVALNLF